MRYMLWTRWYTSEMLCPYSSCLSITQNHCSCIWSGVYEDLQLYANVNIYSALRQKKRFFKSLLSYSSCSLSASCIYMFPLTRAFIVPTNTEFLLQTLQRKQCGKKFVIRCNRLIRTKAPNCRVNMIQSDTKVSLRTWTNRINEGLVFVL